MNRTSDPSFRDRFDAEFKNRFGHRATVRAHAPGRVNLIGEHTDYNDGFVLPTPIPQRTRVEIARRSDDKVRAATASVAPRDEILEYELGKEARRNGWIDFVQGTTRVLAARGRKIGGFDLWIASNVPVGSGLSSSAALEVSLLRALDQAFALDLDALELARLGR